MNNLFVYTNVVSNTREAVFDFLSTKIVEVGKATDEQAVKNGLKLREAEGTTGMMDGFAIPHAKSESIQEPTIIILKLTNAVAWDSLDGQPIKYVIALFIPAAEAGTSHLVLLSQMARMLMDDGFKQAFIAASTQEEIVGLIDSRLEGTLKR
ncbi:MULTISPECIES: fructose PTS transporter subunit IIA [Enterococcus]|uniref:PTS system, fructose-specific IIA component n=1 Tax=Candidatus Enterococcus mangumiae TaxID=2230878 RepID=A0ABZ2T1Q5_9ENTE|nr:MULTISPECIES: fructose PTS transporter subunit IIA [unclassified Enterococcus]MBO0489611.1 PTS sugar transporter subunit IIA [Enterococcus sp. DIV1094]MBO1298429.1 PTS sugar transporter subunit IIA [Enterococcus sp. DIV1271a]